jgi:hypothetical protein
VHAARRGAQHLVIDILNPAEPFAINAYKAQELTGQVVLGIVAPHFS